MDRFIKTGSPFVIDSDITRGEASYIFGTKTNLLSKIKGLGDSSAHWFIATLAVETGIAPSVLMLESERMLWTMSKVLIAKGSQK